MNFKRWKLGLAVATILSLFCAMSGLAAGMNWKAFLSVFATACLTHWGTWITEHPIEKIDDNSDNKI